MKSELKNKIIISDHAIARFQKRICPHLSFDEAKKGLEEACLVATPLKEKTVKGDKVWTVADPPMRLVTRKDSNDIADHVLVTVLPPRVFSEGWTLHELELLEEKRRHEMALLQLEKEKQSSSFPQTPSSLPVPKDVLAIELEIVRTELAIIRESEKTIRHLDYQETEGKRHKHCLRLALRALDQLLDQTSDPTLRARITAAWTEIKHFAPDLLTPEFLQYQKPRDEDEAPSAQEKDY